MASGIVDSYAAAEQALLASGFTVVPVDPKGVVLNGGDAKLLPDFSTAFVRNDVSRAEQASYLAHELGHLDLHRPNEPCEIGQTDLRAAGSRALSRVETYGPRERRELQANVYGREFLLPRDQARRLFLDEGLTATQIAKRLDMPLPHVRRQLIDSLLQRDATPAVEKAPSPPIQLDPSQLEAVNFEGRALLVEAGPGSGKTRTLVARVEHLLAKSIHPSNILALTFSNKSAAELTERIVESHPVEGVEVWTGTFHAFGLEIMRRHYDRMSLSPKVRLLAPSQAVEMLEARLPLLKLKHFHDLREPGLKLKEILKPIFRAKDEIIDAIEFRRLAEVGHATALSASKGTTKKAADAWAKAVETAEKTLEAATVYEVYEKLLRDGGFVDFADLVMRPTLLLEQDAAVRDSLRLQYRDILVDEYQDVNRACARMLQALSGPVNRMWVVGDARQSIYRFRGASSLNMGRFEADFADGKRIPLGFNYRSTDHITGLCRIFASAMDRKRATTLQVPLPDRLPYLAQAKRTNPGSATKLGVGHDDECEADMVAEEIQALVAAGVPFGKQTVLSRVNGRLDTLSRQLTRRGIPVLHLGSFFEREEVRDLLSVLALISEPNGAALVRIAALREVSVEAGDIGVVVTAAHDRNLPLAQVLKNADGITCLSTSGAASLARLGRKLAGLKPWTPAIDVASTWLLERSEYLRDLALDDGVDADLSRAALWQLVEFLDQVEPNGGLLTVVEALRRVRTVIMLADDRDLREPDLGSDVDAVRLMTVHAAKGLQFGAVHLVGLHEGGFPKAHRSDFCRPPPGVEDGRDPKEGHAEEEGCAFFVAISRAEDHLRLYHTEKAAVAPRKPSTFLADLGRLTVARLGQGRLVTRTVPFEIGPIAIEEITLADVRDYEKCPLRLAYRYHLSLRGRRHESAFLKTSGVVYLMLDRLVEAVGDGGDTRERLTSLLDETWPERGPVGDDLEQDYRALATGSIETMAVLAAGHIGARKQSILVPITGGHVRVSPPLYSSPSRPTATARFVEAGRHRVENAKRLTAGLLFVAAQIGSDRVNVEIAHLADGGILPIERTPIETRDELEKAAKILAAVRAGALGPRPEMHTCMRCAHFFSCPATGHRPGR